VSTCTLTGEELWMMMEENLERTFAADPYEQMGGYVKRCLGLNLYFKVENPQGQRIQELFVEGEPVRPSRAYQVAFVTSQGVPAMYGSDRQSLGIEAITALCRYLAKNDPISAELRGSVLAV
jgi:sulfur-oxidizing protein SoxB